MNALSDVEYLESSEINVFLEQLLNELAAVCGNKGEDVNEYSSKFFQRIISCTHVIGMSYAYATQCNYNRRALVCCCVDSFSCFPNTVEISILEAYHLLRLICNDFPRQFIEDAAHPLLTHGVISSVTTNAAQKNSGSGQLLLYNNNPKCSVLPLQSAIYVSLIYEEWLKLVEGHFRSYSANALVPGNVLANNSDGSGATGASNSRSLSFPNTIINVNKLGQYVNQLRGELPVKVPQPHKDALDSILKVLSNIPSGATSGGGGGNSLTMKDITFDYFKKELFVYPIIMGDVFRRPLAVAQQQHA